MLATRRNSRVTKEIGIEERVSDVRFHTGSRNEPGSRMRIEQYAISVSYTHLTLPTILRV